MAEPLPRGAQCLPVPRRNTKRTEDGFILPGEQFGRLNSGLNRLVQFPDGDRFAPADRNEQLLNFGRNEFENPAPIVATFQFRGQRRDAVHE